MASAEMKTSLRFGANRKSPVGESFAMAKWIILCVGTFTGSFLGTWVFNSYLDGPQRIVIREVTDFCEIPVALQDAQQRHACANR